MPNLTSLNVVGTSASTEELPSSCPICHFSIAPIHRVSKKVSDKIESCFECTNVECLRLFIAVYGNPFRLNNANVWRLQKTLPVTQQTKEFPDSINAISNQFGVIYNEAYAAEQFGLKEICGVGYRKSLEFLIKDYLIGRLSEGEGKAAAAEEIKKKFLGTCIKEDIADTNIKLVAQRATWLGNDETHYVRRWEDRDVKDLKKLIALTVNLIESEALTAQALLDMPGN